ncbi:chromatin structure-remodeling complex subunit SFH1 [Rhizoctonia solani]|uniref:Chromatin structure-remodeling complex subunit SFH1 n=1 Tax=Rhizoctonia solani TaxID=456999 RepID=A0A0K6G9L1_9AGAM|nr:chromatin structure-remodeling complex subunit SFH1 [Rhizoctonia solani]
MQPLGLAPVPPNHNPTQPPPPLAHAASFGPSRRTRGGVVNYAELEDEEDENVDVEGESSGPALVAPTGVPGNPRTAGELDRNYLGAIPPAKFIHPLKATRIHQEYFSEARLAEAASKRAVYVPIRLELNTESHQIRDSFLWNVNETLITPAAFAHQLCLDLAIPPAQHAELIAAAISAQCEEHRWIANVQVRARRKRKGLTTDQENIRNDSTEAIAKPGHSGTADSDQTTHLRDPRIEALRAELHGSSLASGQSTPGTGTGIATASLATSAASPASDGHVTPAPISVNIDDELDPMNNIDGQKNQASTTDDKRGLTPAPDATAPSSKAGDKATAAGQADNRNDDAGSDVDSETDYETDSEADEPDCRVIVNLDLQISTHHLHDHIEWDLGSPLTPEHFARVLCADTGLAGEAVPLVACALREALLKHTKDALEAGLIGPGAYDGRPDPLGALTKKEAGSETLRSILRDWQDAEEYFPRLELLSAEELERRAMERERAIRRMRRETQRWGQSNVSRKRFRER